MLSIVYLFESKVDKRLFHISHNNKLNKSNILYHASSSQGLKTLDPTKVESTHNKNKRSSVYATNDKSYASGFSFPHSNAMGIEFGSINNSSWILEIPRKYLQLLDKPCSMYEVDSSTFKPLSINVPEFISYSKVRIIKETKFVSAKECMKHYATIIRII